MIDEEGRLVRIDYGDRIYFDSVLGIAGTTYPIGTAGMPSDVIANAITICVARNINKIHVIGTLAIGAGIAQNLVGHNSILTAQTAGAAYVREFSGYLEIDAMVGGTLDIYAYGAEIQINADCTAGTINIYGVANVTDNSAAGCTVNNYTVPYQIDAMRGGAETLESLDDELDAMLDVAKEPSTTVMTGPATEDELFNLAGVVPFFVAGVWLGLENMVAVDSIRFRAYADWDDASIADRISDDVIWTFTNAQDPTWVYMPLNRYITYQFRVTGEERVQGAGGAKTVYCVVDTGVRGT